MLPLLVRPLLICITLFSVTIAAIRIGYGVNYQPQRAFSHENCDQPCWRGLAVGSSTAPEVSGMLGIESIPIYQRYLHEDTHGAVYILLHDTLVYMEAREIDCPVGLFLALGAPDFATRYRANRSEQMVLYFFTQAGSYTVMWEADAAFTLYQTNSEPILSTLQNETITWSVALADLKAHCS